MAEKPPVFDLLRPAVWNSGVVISSPHSGCDYPPWVLAESRLSLQSLRSSEDAFVDRLVRPAQAAGAVVLTARVPRSVVDLNRSPDELDALVVRNLQRKSLSPRVMAGLGVIPRVVAGGQAIRRTTLTEDEARARLDLFWRPYHNALSGLLAEAVRRFGGALLIDFHSMPHEALIDLDAPLPDVVVGDRNGISASPGVVSDLCEIFTDEGFHVARNLPFAGAYITQAYGRPSQNIHVMQVEIDRSLYMNEQRIEPLPGFDLFAARMARIMRRLARLRPPGFALPIIAE